MDPIVGPIRRRPRSMRPNILVTNLPTLSTHDTVRAYFEGRFGLVDKVEFKHVKLLYTLTCTVQMRYLADVDRILAAEGQTHVIEGRVVRIRRYRGERTYHKDMYVRGMYRMYFRRFPITNGRAMIRHLEGLFPNSIHSGIQLEKNNKIYTGVAKIRFKDRDSRTDARRRAQAAGLQWRYTRF